MTTVPTNGEDSPFPSSADMDLDIMHASNGVHPDNHYRIIEGVAGAGVAYVHGTARLDAERDTLARRIEMMGDLYDELRNLADRARAAGMDVEQAESVLSEPCTRFCCTFRPQSRPRSPRMVPGAAVVGSVVPASERNPSITRLPARRIATDGPDIMNSSSGS